MLLYPDFYFKNIKEVDIKLLKDNNIKALLLDVDNTLIDLDRNILDGAVEWCDSLKKEGIKFCILSNSNKKDKVAKVAKTLNVPFIFFGTKPLKRGFKKAKKLLNLDFKNMAIIGDQIFTDVIGGNRCKMFTVLVEPSSTRELFITSIKRGVENKIIKNYNKKRATAGKAKQK